MSLRWSLVVLSAIILSAVSDDGVLVTEDKADSAGEDALRSYLVGLMTPSRGRPRSLEEDQSRPRWDSYAPPRAVAARSGRTLDRESSGTGDETTTAPSSSTTAPSSSTTASSLSTTTPSSSTTAPKSSASRIATTPDDLEDYDYSMGTAQNTTSGSGRCGGRGWRWRGWQRPFGFGGFPGGFGGGFGGGFPGAFPGGGFGFGGPFMMG